MVRNVFLIGPMGVGKTTVGRHLARILGADFLDSDSEIERRTGVSIRTIFDIEGEEGFRKREATVIDELTQREGIVLATGGGAVLVDETRRALRTRGTVVYLHATIDTQMRRTRMSRDRPLLDTDDREGRLESLMEVREPLYRQEADLIITTDRRSPAKVAREIADKLETPC